VLVATKWHLALMSLPVLIVLGSSVSQELLSARQIATTVGLAERPLGPARWGHIGTHDLYQAILEGTPYPVRVMIGFGANVLLAHANGRHRREALEALEFYAHADLFMNPTAELADAVLPVASALGHGRRRASGQPAALAVSQWRGTVTRRGW
jgi:anaerobic selenocysteine-containing dehydrogenase